MNGWDKRDEVLKEKYVQAILSLYRQNLRPPTVTELATKLGYTKCQFLKGLRHMGVLLVSEPKNRYQHTVLPQVKMRVHKGGVDLFWG